MADYPYTGVPGKLKPLLQKIREIGTPKKVSVAWLKSIGFTSSNDSSLIAVLKFVGICDQSGVPSDVWAKYRGIDHKSILGNAIRNAYSDLFSVYENANLRQPQELYHFFSTKSTAGKQAIDKTISTFKALCEEAEFSATMGSNVGVVADALNDPPPAAPANGTNGIRIAGTTRAGQHRPSLHIDIQIHISPESSGEQIEKIFESMAKHLYGHVES